MKVSRWRRRGGWSRKGEEPQRDAVKNSISTALQPLEEVNRTVRVPGRGGRSQRINNLPYTRSKHTLSLVVSLSLSHTLLPSDNFFFLNMNFLVWIYSFQPFSFLLVLALPGRH